MFDMPFGFFKKTEMKPMLTRGHPYFDQYPEEDGLILVIDEWATDLASTRPYIGSTVVTILRIGAKATFSIPSVDWPKSLLHFLFREDYRNEQFPVIKDEASRGYFEDVYDALILSVFGIKLKIELACCILPYIKSGLSLNELNELGIDYERIIAYIPRHHLSQWLDRFECSLCPDMMDIHRSFRLRLLLS
jgi:hypothetical protein